MIQRIQTIWLSIGAVAAAYLFKGPLVILEGEAGNTYYLVYRGIRHIAENGQVSMQSSVAIPLLIVMIPLLSVAAIFLYKKRAVQKILSLVIFTLSLCLIIVAAYHSIHLVKEFHLALRFGPGLIIPPISCIVSLLAYRGVSRDDNLVKSYDRLR